MHVLVPMSGQGKRFKRAGYALPKPLISVNGASMISRLMRSFPTEWPAVFVMAENHRDTALPDELRRVRPLATQAFVPCHDRGPGVAILEGLRHIPGDAPVLVTYCDYGMVWDNAQFEHFVRDSQCDACIISYRGFHAHYLSPQMYAYSRLDDRDGECVREIREKGCFSANREAEFASCGGYYFRSCDLLRRALEYQFQHGMLHEGEAYTSLTVEALLRMGSTGQPPHVRIFEIPGFFQWGTPEDLGSFVYWESTFQAVTRSLSRESSVGCVIMPMAGEGSRFVGVTTVPKPFIEIGGLPMSSRALASLPRAESGRHVIVALECHRHFFENTPLPRDSTVFLPSTPAGQALSVEAGLNLVPEGTDVLVSASDHAIAMDGEKWERFRSAGGCDAAIFTIRGFPGVGRRPHDFSYVSTHPDGEFPRVAAVSVKQPLSADPVADRLLVGSFWFKDVGVLRAGIDLLKESGARTNGEMYLDAVFDFLKARGYTVKAFDLDGYVNWGDPESLAEAMYWHEAFLGHRLDRRPRYPGLSAPR